MRSCGIRLQGEACPLQSGCPENAETVTCYPEIVLKIIHYELNPRDSRGWCGKAASTGQEIEEASMLKKNRILRKLDPLLLLTLLVSLSVFMTSTVDAADEPFLSTPNLPDLFDGDVFLTKTGHRGADVYMSFQTPSNKVYNEQPGGLDASVYVPVPDLFMSMRIRW